MTEQVVKRPRLRQIDLETVNDALECYINFLNKQLSKHEEDPTRFKKQDAWLQKREMLNWKLANANHAQAKVAMNLKGVKGRTPDCLEALLNLTAKDNPGKYIKAILAIMLLPYGDFEKDLHALMNAIDRGFVSSFIDSEEQIRKVKKLDVIRYAAYLETHKT